MRDIIYNESNLETMSKMDNSSVQGIITSPPYNLTSKRKDCYYNNGYQELDNKTPQDYIVTRLNEFKEFSRVMDNKGVILYNISYHNENPILPTNLISEVHYQTDLTLADIITWKKSNSIPFQTSPTKLSRITELIYVIVKKQNLHSFTTNKKVSKVNEKTGQKFYKNYHNIIEAKNNDGIKTSLKATFSEELVIKLLDIYFPEGSIIYDPFSGIGTTCRACKKTNRHYIASEIKKEHYDLSVDLINYPYFLTNQAR